MTSARAKASVVAHQAGRAGSTLRWPALVSAGGLFAIAVGRQPTVRSPLLTAYFGVAFLAMAHRVSRRG